MAEHLLPKQRVASSSLVSRSTQKKAPVLSEELLLLILGERGRRQLLLRAKSNQELYKPEQSIYLGQSNITNLTVNCALPQVNRHPDFTLCHIEISR